MSRVAVVGAGMMGNGIAHVFALHGWETALVDVSRDALDRAVATIRANLDRQARKGAGSGEQSAQVLARIETHTTFEAAGRADLVVEAATENPEIKFQIFRELDRVAPPAALLATNTSSISVTAIAAQTKRPAQVIGMHFMNPVPVMKLIEFVRALTTSDETLETARAFGESLGKRIIVSKDRAGFIVNYLLVPYMIEAIRLLEQGFATKEDIDVGMMLGTGYPMGPFTLLDFVGLDTTLYITDILFEEFKEPRFAAPTLLRRMVAAGWLGRKSGRGFYNYQAGEKPPER